jgi:catechol 2,3-dioxygenase-like lactoylglutathione lyase family enzyme
VLNLSAITLFVADPSRAKALYTGAFGATVVYEDDAAVTFRFETLLVNLLKSSEATELIEPVEVGVGDAGARFQLTLTVDDVDAAAVRVADAGFRHLNGPIDRPWGVRTAAFADFDGHVWELAAPLAG